ncbi:TonB-dependent receptor domain-containing protein [Cereibacter sphaeroides]|uniref:TonB-dependent receptor domain-containing protein n=1 Tax=Cereibacter sphaeroides TaxID=1063 RepID=UPI000191CE67|nr:TonB-dependent receptor precursor [Cereibacter sphaeroides KD131]
MPPTSHAGRGLSFNVPSRRPIAPFSRRGRRALLAAGTVLSTGLTAQAQTAAEPIALDQITVTAGGFDQNVADAPASVSIITREDLERGNVTSLSDALREAQGVVTTGVAGEQDIFIRGLPGAYTLILVDGKRQGTRESRTNGNAGWEQSFIPPVAAIERIEVVRGPMSSLYGSDAMGGVINIITRKVADRWSGSVTAETVLPEASEDSGNRQLSFYLSGPVVPDRLGLQIWGRVLDQDEAELLSGQPGQEDRDLTARLTWALTEDQELRLEAGRTGLDRDLTPGRTLDETANPSRQKNIREHWSVSHSGRWGDVTTDLSFQQEKGRRTTWSTVEGRLVEDERAPEIVNSVLDAKVTVPLTWAGSHTLVGGGQYKRADLTDQNPGIGDGRNYDWQLDEWALFLEDEWRLHPDFALTLGARYTQNEDFGGHVTPRLYGVWNVTPDLTIKGGASAGYRTPEIRQTAAGYYYTTERGAGVIVANSDLDPESSTSYEIGALWQSGRFELGATAYRTDFADKIESRKTDRRITVGGTDYNRWEWYNVQDATLTGVELTARAEITDNLSLRGSYTWTHSEQESGDYEGLPLARTPEHMASLRLDWLTPVDGLEAWSAATYHGSEINAGARIGSNGRPYAENDAGQVIAYKYGSYATVDVGASYRVSEAMMLNAAVYNLFDEGISVEEQNASGSGRRLWVGLTANF